MKLIKKAALAAKLDMHPESLMRIARERSDFPRPVTLHDGVSAPVYFDEAAVDAYLAERAAATCDQ